MTTWSFFRPSDGVFVSDYSGPEKYLKQFTPDGCLTIEGVFDHRSQRVDPSTIVDPVQTVIDWQPPAPADTELVAHEWDAQTKRWIGKPTRRAGQLARIADVQAQIEREERRQARPMRELLLLVADDTQREAARRRLDESDAAIALLRARRNEIDNEEA